jgi:hypothetical protein
MNRAVKRKRKEDVGDRQIRRRCKMAVDEILKECSSLAPSNAGEFQ